MKKLKNIFAILFIPILLVGIFLYSSISNQQKIFLEKERNINKSISLVKKINLQDKYDLLKVVRDSLFLVSWKKENKGKIYYYDETNNKVVNYLSLGNNTLISDYYEGSKDALLILNKSEQKLIEISHAIPQNKSINLNKPISRGVRVKDNLYFTAYGSDVVMKFYNLKLNNNQSFEIKNNIFNKDEKNTGVIYDGVLKYNGNNIILTPYAKNEVLFFDTNFKFKSKMKLINKDVEFKFTKMENGDVLPDPTNLYPNIYSDLDAEKLYILTNESGIWDSKDKYYIDVYDIKNKKYLFTYFIDDPSIFPREIIVLENLIYILGKDKINS